MLNSFFFKTFFSMQVQRYADLYAADFNNLLNYPLFYTFIAPPQYLPHEMSAPRPAQDEEHEAAELNEEV